MLRPVTAADTDAVTRLLHLAFTGSREDAREWHSRIDAEHLRVFGSPAHGCLVLLPMAQCFGGRAVEMVGVQAVAVAPESRRRGTALAMMRDALREMHDGGVPLSSLFPSVSALYRRAGYGAAGGAYHTSISLRELAALRRVDAEGSAPGRIPEDAITGTSETIALDPSHDAALHACQASFAAGFDGAIPRPGFRWLSVIHRAGAEHEGYAVVAPGVDPRERIEGFLFVGRRREGDAPAEAIVGDVAFRDAAAGRRLLSLLAGLAPTAPTARLFVPPWHPFLALLGATGGSGASAAQALPVPIPWIESRCTEAWMLRIVRLPEAIAGRGWPRCAAASLRLDVRDDLLEGNGGSWVLDVEGGEGRLRRPSRADDQPTVTLGIDALATIYAGWMRPGEAALAGLLAGDDGALAIADSLFPGPRPWLSDRF
ncbi:MAG TPA: GNAT family N-acetyltransferase [Phycisphaerales bacterium]|nr:GNAT family N-acetyltransferase [Phycisphaerales bacterium]HMP38136.1 GNAT family N-acetyltransferase [Phycisphaerales bacterium]